MAKGTDSAFDVRDSWEMTNPKVPRPKDIKAAAQAAADSAQAAAQAAAEAAQAVAGSALRIPPASIQLATQLPDLIENLATATERLNQAIDRAERYLALADPMIRTMDAILPQLEALVATGNEVYGAVSSLPGVATLGRLANRGTAAATKRTSRGKAAPKKTK
ncbi:hypothetical protein MMOR_35060 [Mycolicibacterium moriokaense]|uniref:Uncharacterized protein n=2 Tax=Mycolicibacterium moriokaense TaxID=39691 RepID=A0AAD1HCZ2_9MYCO|nr:hypothetical protein MMOR_35060 [Mycolicibacterium moriokaense]